MNDFSAAFRERGPRLTREFQAALAAMPDQELGNWASSIPALARDAAVRRGLGVKRLLGATLEISRREWRAGHTAWSQGHLLPHLKGRMSAAGTTARDFAKTGGQIATTYAKLIAESPRTEVPVLVASVIGFMAGSGGLDGDGGIPDLDLIGGIGAHRSLFTHTIVAGILAETLVLAFVDIAGRLHDYLPADHDPVWNYLDQRDSRVVAALVGGVSAGLAYHFAVDATVDSGGAYAAGKGVVPPVADDGFQAANAFAEGLRSANKSKQRTPKNGSGFRD